MNPREQFKIETEEELREAYEMFNYNWLKNITLDYELECFRNDNALRYITRDVSGDVFLSGKTNNYKTIPSPLKNKNMLNKKLIQRLRDGEIAVVNDGKIEQLREILNEAFPVNSTFITGKCIFYYSDGWNKNTWWGSHTNIENKEEVSVKDFFNISLDLKGFPEKYVLKDKSYKSAFPEELFVGKDNDSIRVYKELYMLDLYKPVYKKVEPKLPEINGYKGEIVSKCGEIGVKYGCAYLDFGWFRVTNNRSIDNITLSSGVILNKSEIEQIRKYLIHYGHI